MSELLENFWNSGGGLLATILDLVIVFYLVYIILLLVRGTRTVPMFIGLLVIVILYFISQYYGLATTYWLLDQFMEVAVIFALIIFQDDIRRALVRMGRFAWFSKAKESKVLEEVIRAARSMASKRIGAIIVFERDGSLSEFIEAGTTLDAAVTRELLYTIFIPRMENPLHDGAVILKSFRIREAGALLPLSNNTDLDRNMGTRHRAALGITEITDAVSIVISEERGTVTVCYDGKIERDLDNDGLRTTLLSLFTDDKTSRQTSAPSEAPPSPTEGDEAVAPSEAQGDQPGSADKQGNLDGDQTGTSKNSSAGKDEDRSADGEREARAGNEPGVQNRASASDSERKPTERAKDA